MAGPAAGGRQARSSRILISSHPCLVRCPAKCVNLALSVREIVVTDDGRELTVTLRPQTVSRKRKRSA